MSFILRAFSARCVSSSGLTKNLPTIHAFSRNFSSPAEDVGQKRDAASKEDSSALVPNLQKDDMLTLFHKQSNSMADFTSPELKSLMWQSTELDISKLKKYYKKLTKFGLTRLVVVSTMGGYAMAPGVFDPFTFGAVSVGTFLCSAAAISTNQFLEIPYDSQMNRTNERPLVRRYLSPLHGMAFSAGSLACGASILWFGVNPLTAGLGVLNYFLYSYAYTPVKRVHISNTWVGAIVGAIPPMMGWAACTGSLDAGAYLLGAILFAWQFPHFNGLSWKLRPDYSRAGYCMSAVTHPNLCKRVAFRYAFSMIPLCTLAPIMDLTTWTFPLITLPINLAFSWYGWRFYRDNDSKSAEMARKLFFCSLIQLPIVMALMIYCRTNTQEQTLKPEPGEPECSDCTENNQKSEKGAVYFDQASATAMENIILPGSKL